MSVRERGQLALSYFWWAEQDEREQPKEYTLTVHVFRTVSLPVCANFALRNNPNISGARIHPLGISIDSKRFLR